MTRPITASFSVFALLALFVGLLLLYSVTTARAVGHCQFRGDFAALRDLIGHDIVGECGEEEHYNATGDRVQKTQHGSGSVLGFGLFVWRRADGRTMWTDGGSTWILGPDGLQKRSNQQRFSWEPDYTPDIAATPLPVVIRPTSAPSPIPWPTPTPKPTPRPTSRPTPAPIEARLQDALDLIATTNAGRDAILPRFGTVDIVFGDLPDDRLAHYDPNTRQVVFAESMRHAPLEIIAWILVHESMHVVRPWTERGEECYDSERAAEFSAALWWREKYGEAGHPNTGHELIRYFNWLASMVLGDLERFRQVVTDQYREVCGEIAPTPTPTPWPTATPRPTPLPIAVGSTLDDVEHMFRHYRAFGERAIAEAHGISQGSARASTIYDWMWWAMEGMPFVYLLYTWSEYPSGEYPDTREFARSYVGNSRYYAVIAYRWLESDPCTWPQDVQEYMMAHAIAYPGHIRGLVEATLRPDFLATHAFNAALSTAERDYFNDAETYLDQFRCSS